MKFKIIYCCFFIIAAAPVSAQYKKGDIILGGNLNLYTDGTRLNAKNINGFTNLQLQADAAIALKKNMLLGARVGFGRVNGNTFFTTGRESGFSANYSLAPELYLRKYAPLGKKISLFTEVALSYTRNRYFASDSDAVGGAFSANMKSHVATTGLSAGLSYKLSDRVRLELAVNNIISARYAWTKGNRQYVSGTPSIPLSDSRFEGNMLNNKGLNISLGIKIGLGKK